MLVRVHAAGVNPVDWKIREGCHRSFLPLDLPAALGREVAGVVVAAGPGVTGVSVVAYDGDNVQQQLTALLPRGADMVLDLASVGPQRRRLPRRFAALRASSRRPATRSRRSWQRVR